MRFLAQTCEVFDGRQPNRKPQDHIDGNQTAKLQPGKRGAVDAEPQRLSNDDICFSRFFSRKAPMKKIHDRQRSTGERQQYQDKKSPARPYIRKGFIDKKIQTAPARDHQHERGEAEWSEFELFIH